MIRLWPTVALAVAVAGAAGSTGLAKASDVYEVYDQGRLVLTFEPHPGVLTSSALAKAGAAPIRHPFLSGSTHAPDEEDRLRAILDRSKDARDFMDRLRRDGFVVVRPTAAKAR